MKLSRNFLFAFLFVLSAGLFSAGCDSQNSDDEDTPPELLSSEVFTIDTSLFSSGATKDAATKAHFFAAAFRVWPVSILINANLIIPSAITAAALQDTPEFIDGAWEWDTTTQVDESTVQFALSARPSGSIIDWSLRISGTNPEGGAPFEEFELVTARSTVGEQAGSWQLYYPVNGVSTNVLNADFVVDAADTKSLTFSIPVSAAENGGDSVLYETSGDSRSFFWQQIGAALDHDISWDFLTKAGSITATNYNSGVEGCWDTNFDDIDCG